MPYQVVVPRRVQKQMLALPQTVYDRVREHLAQLGQDPRPPGVRKLKGQADTYRLRVGDYRIIYTIDDAAQQVQVMTVEHRKDVYR